MFDKLKKDIVERYHYLINKEQSYVLRRLLIAQMYQELEAIDRLEHVARPSSNLAFSLN